MSEHKQLRVRAMLVYFGVVVFAIAIAVRLFQIQLVEGDKWRAKAESVSTTWRTVQPERGHIYSEDGRLLATSVPEYDVRMDLATDALTDERFNANIDSLAWHLANLFADRTKEEYRRDLTDARHRKERYYLVKRRASHTQVQALRTFPLYRDGRFKSGLVTEKRLVRMRPFGRLASRSVGYVLRDSSALAIGLEGGYNKWLSGVTGRRLERRLAGGVWMPIDDGEGVDPEPGSDVHTTIDVNLQDVADAALERQLLKHGAQYGCVVVMEVATGYIKAISNLTRVDDSTYVEALNYAVGEATEPGSTFKLASLMVGLEEGLINPEDTVDTNWGRVRYYDRIMKDAHEDEYKKVTVRRAFELSLNTGISLAVTKAYGKEPKKFIEGLKRFHLNEPTGVMIPGEPAPTLRGPGEKGWSGVSLPWMSIGYEVALTPMQSLTFYNAVANNGRMMQPQFVSHISRNGRTTEKFEPRVLNERICSDKTLVTVRGMLRAVVDTGTATNLKGAHFPIAGKTGTAQIARNGSYKQHGLSYQASFVGYFPADAPKYSCIVVVNGPTMSGIYGNVVAGPVFKEIADKIYSNRLELQQETLLAQTTGPRSPVSMSGSASDLRTALEGLGVPFTLEGEGEWMTTEAGDSLVAVRPRKIPSDAIDLVPNVLGMGLKDALYILENRGLHVRVQGNGMVKRQSLPPGTRAFQGSTMRDRAHMKLLKDILYKVRIEQVEGSTNTAIEKITFDSRQVVPFTAFVAVRGTQVDGHDFIEKAVESGASAIVCEELPATLKDGITYVRVPNAMGALGILAANYFDHPSKELKLVGITGTNGKTSVATLLFRMFRALGYKCGLISTVEIRIGQKTIASTHTTPDAVRLNELIAEMLDAGVTHCFMEVSSHSVVQERITGLRFAAGVFTNITHDHLDYHGTFAEYIKAKKRFFDQLPASAFALVNADDANSAVMLQNTKATRRSYAVRTMADHRARVIENQLTGLHLNIDGHDVYARLVGEFNASNLLAVYATAILLGEVPMNVLTALSDLEPPRGRFQVVRGGGGILGIVDYAHTPDALKNVLTTINDICAGNEQVITVVGCGGDRDRTKRPVMAQIAANLSGHVVLTSDNPRSEDPMAILGEMRTGIAALDQHRVFVNPDRREAIRQAVSMAKAGDVVLLAGKGHETYQEIAGVKHPFDDAAVLKETLELLHK